MASGFIPKLEADKPQGKELRHGALLVICNQMTGAPEDGAKSEQKRLSRKLGGDNRERLNRKNTKGHRKCCGCFVI